MRKACGLLLCALGLGLVALPVRAEVTRAGIAAERAALAQRFDAEERACAERFAVYACVEEVRARRRAALAPLREQELRLDEAERRRRADERRAAVAQKQAEVARRPPPPPEPELRLRPAPPSPVAPGAAPALPAPAKAAAAHEAAEAARRAQSLREAGERAEAAEARIRERRARQAEALAAKGRQPDTLPRPAAKASAPPR